MTIQFNQRIVLILMAVLLVLSPIGLRASLAAGAAADKKEDKDTELSKHMEVIQDNLKKLRKTVKDAAGNKDTLTTLSKLQAETVASKELVPAKAANVPEADRAKFLAGYRKDMAALLEHLCKIETAILDNDNAKADDLFKGLKKVEEDGHEKYSDQ